VNFLHDKEAAFGLFRYPPGPTPDPKPSFIAAQTFARVLGRARFARELRRPLGLPPDAYAFGFRSPRETIVVLWALRDGVPARVRARGPIRQVSLAGEERDIPGREARLVLGPSPVYLVLEAGAPRLTRGSRVRQ
jgi:hypothetical protein